MKLIDVHTHIFPDALAARVLPKLGAAASLSPYTDGTLSGTLCKMDEWGVDESWLMSIATNAHQMRSVNDFALSVRAQTDRIVPFGSVYPFAPDALSEAQRLYDNGIWGIKLHPEYQTFEVSDERVFPLYEFLAKHNMVVLFHAGRDRAFPDTNYASPKSIARVVDLFPDLTIIAAHLGGAGLHEEVLANEVGKNLYFDTAFLNGDIDGVLLRRIITGHGTDKILFGTDAPWSTPPRELELLKSINLTDDEMEQITHLNAERLKQKHSIG